MATRFAANPRRRIYRRISTAVLHDGARWQNAKPKVVRPICDNKQDRNPQRSSLLPYRGVLSFRSEAREEPGNGVQLNLRGPPVGGNEAQRYPRQSSRGRFMEE